VTLTEPTTADLAAGLADAVPAVLGAIPGAAAWTAEPLVAPPAPAASSRTVAVDRGGITLALVADAALARHLQVGPPPAEDLREGAFPALAALAAALGLDPVSLSEVEEVAALPPAGAAEGLRLLEDGTERALVLALLADAPRSLGADPDPDWAPHGAAAPAPSPRPQRRPAGPTGLELLHEVEMDVTAELGRTRLLLREVLDLAPGSVIELDRAAGSPVDVLVNSTLIARGEVVVIDEEFGVRITEVVGYEDESGR
jgi:flagellar motor switch protein FliN/FliY